MDTNMDISLVGGFWCESKDTILLPTILMCECVPIFRVSIGVEKLKTKKESKLFLDKWCFEYINKCKWT